MFRPLLIALALLGGTAACNLFTPAVQGSGVQAGEDRQVAAFESVALEGSCDVDIVVGPAQSVRVEGDDNIVPLISTTVADNTLRISSDSSYTTKLPARLTITVPELIAVVSSGSGDITARDITAGSFAASMQGSGSIRLTGTADELTANLQGSGSLSAATLTTSRVTVSLQGSGSAEVHTREQLTASINGSGSVRYTGGATNVTQNIAGSGKVSPI